jgi:hypothetical protein
MLPTKFWFIWLRSFKGEDLITHFDPIRLQTWPPQTILVSALLISKRNFSSATAEPNKPNLGSNNLWKVVY